MANSENSDPAPNHLAASRFAERAIRQGSDDLRREASIVVHDEDISVATEAAYSQAVDSLMWRLQIFRHWLPANYYDPIHETLIRAARVCAATSELRVFIRELTEPREPPLLHLEGVREQVTTRLWSRWEQSERIRYRVKSPAFQDDVDRLVNALSWRGKESEPTLADITSHAIDDASYGLLGTTDSSSTHLTTLHTALQQINKLCVALDLFQDSIAREPREQLENALKQLYDKVEPLVDCSLTTMLSTRWLGKVRDSQEAADVQALIPYLEQQGRRLSDELQQALAAGIRVQISDGLERLQRSLGPAA